MRHKRPSVATVVAFVALVVALGGTAIAANHYLITSTSQIKPRVLRKLTAQSSRVVARLRSTAPVTTTSSWPWPTVPLSAGGAWTQEPTEVDQITGQAAVTVPSAAECAAPRRGGTVTISLGMDDQGGTQRITGTGPTAETVTVPIDLEPMFEPGKRTSHGFKVQAFDNCTTGAHGVVTAVALDIIGVS